MLHFLSDMESSFIDTLLELGVIDQEQLNNSINYQWKRGGELEESLIRLGYFNEDSLFTVLARKFPYYPVSLDTIEVNHELLNLIPSWIVKRFLVVPLKKSNTSLAVAMVNPVDKNAINNLKQAVYLDILPFVAKKSEIENFIFKHYGPDMPEKVMEEVSEETEDDKQATGFTPLKAYTFDNFVTGKCNDFAYSMALAVSRGYSQECNPFFIFSDCGLGKTHLLVAIWNYIVDHRQKRKVLFCSSDRFATELTQAIESNTLDSFRLKYEKIDVLLIDDIGLIAGNEVVQYHFFNIFNELFHNSKQIAVTSDRAPRELLTLSDRLRSRFEGGVIARIAPPDLETRISILKFKARSAKIPDELISLIAESVNSNIRELEGVLKDLLIFSKYKKEALTKDDVEEILMKRSILRPQAQ